MPQPAPCPQCGCPVAGAQPPRRPVQTERTGKRYKGAETLFWLIAMVGGVWWLFYLRTFIHGGAGAIGFLVLLVGILGVAIAKTAAWWSHD